LDIGNSNRAVFASDSSNSLRDALDLIDRHGEDEMIGKETVAGRNQKGSG
jgi:hypothetical protein